MKIVYSDPKTGRTAQTEVQAERSAMLLNYRINDTIDGALIGMQGYKLKITGGSDKSGFPLVKGIGGAIKTSVLRKISNSGKSKGMHERLTVRGSTISADTEQINTVIVEYGASPSVNELFQVKEKPAAESKKEKAK